MRHCLSVGIIWSLLISGMALGDDGASAQPAPTEGAAKPKPTADVPAASQEPPKTEEAKLLSAVREALERNAQDIKSLKEQYAKDIAEQKKKVEAQQKQIESLERSAQVLQDRLKTQVAAPNAAAPNAAAAQNAQEQDRQKQLTDLQQKEIGLLEQQSKLIAEQLEQQAPAIEKLQGQTATLESREKQAAQRDLELGDAHDSLNDSVDAQRRNPPGLPASLNELFTPSGNNATPLSIYSTMSTRYNLFNQKRGAGQFTFEQFTPFFLIQLNKRMLLSAQTSFTPAGVGLVQAQLDLFINDWLTADVGYFLAPIGFWNERLDPVWINKLPDVPLVMRQVIPDNLTISGLQFRGAKYLFGSPIKMEYAIFASNGLGVPGGGKEAGWANLGTLSGTTSGVNNAAAYGGRIGLWIPTRGINFGVSEFVNSPYSKSDGAVVSIWQPYFNYHRGNWDFRFEYGNNYEYTKTFIGDNIDRTGFYTQVAYRDYQSLKKHKQRLEYVFRYSKTMFHGINQAGAAANASLFGTPMNVPVDRNQYTIGVNYYLNASTVLKLAYEINSEVRQSLHDDLFMVQFATNF
jgi:hypothetical protein